MTNKKNGFTLVELSLVLIIFSVIILALVAVYSNYIEKMKIERQKKVVENAVTSIESYRLRYGHYPCPARAGLTQNDPNYGLADCAGTTNVAGVLHGVFPLRSVEAGVEQSLISIGETKFDAIQTNFIDPWRNELRYAVTRNLSTARLLPVPVAFNDRNGLIAIRDEFNRPTGGVTTDLLAHFVVVSYGDNDTCASMPQLENCNNDNVFVEAIRNDSNVAPFDDEVSYTNKSETNIWEDILDSNAGNSASGNARTIASGNVGIGENNPSAKLDVTGNVLMRDAYDWDRGRLISYNFCDGTNCGNVTSLRDDVNCPAGTYMSSITINPTDSTYSANCQPINYPLAGIDCSTRGGIREIGSDGTFQCLYL